MRLNAKQIAYCTGGTFVVDPLEASFLLTGLVWDSREVFDGCLYVALPGERVDGHSFVTAALRSGARGALVMQPLDDATLLLAKEMGAAVIEVPDTAAAITDIAREWRTHLKGKVIGLTGSTGKTTTKNLVRDVLAAKYRVVATKANQNNELGVPKTILNANPETEMIVVEMGMRGMGQIASLCEFVRPQWGIITNVGDSHIELLGSRENIARAKSELIAALPAASGVAFLNGADDMTDFMLEATNFGRLGNSVVCFDGSGNYRASDKSSLGWRHRPAVWAEDVSLDSEGRPHFTLCERGFSEDFPPDSSDDTEIHHVACHLSLRGLHNVHNACAAAAVGLQAGISLEAVAEALAGSLPEAGRQEILKARGGFTIINDAYNANPDSMRAALSTFCSLDIPGARVAVLGDMGELGSFAQACHEGIGKLAATLPLDCLVCVGELAQHIADAALAAGMDGTKVVRAATIADVLQDLDIRLHPGDAVLVKASHFMELNRVVEGLVS